MCARVRVVCLTSITVKSFSSWPPFMVLNHVYSHFQRHTHIRHSTDGVGCVIWLNQLSIYQITLLCLFSIKNQFLKKRSHEATGNKNSKHTHIHILQRHCSRIICCKSLLSFSYCLSSLSDECLRAKYVTHLPAPLDFS